MGILAYFLGIALALTLAWAWQQKHVIIRQGEVRASYERSLNAANSTAGVNRQRILQLEGQVESMRTAAQAAADMMSEKLPSLDGDWGLVALAAKLCNEYEDLKSSNGLQAAFLQDAMNEAAVETADELHDRVRWLSKQAAILGGTAELLGCRPGECSDSIVEKVTTIQSLHLHYAALGASIDALKAWLGAKKDESLKSCIQRVVLTAEVAPGAAQELLNVRRLLNLSPGETVLQALTQPMPFIAKIKVNQGKVVGIGIYSERQWPRIGDVEMTVEAL